MKTGKCRREHMYIEEEKKQREGVGEVEVCVHIMKAPV